MNPLLNPNQTLAEQYDVSSATLVKPYTKKELMSLYDIPEKSFSLWLAQFKEEIGKRKGRFYTVKQVEMIFVKLGVPYVLREK